MAGELTRADKNECEVCGKSRGVSNAWCQECWAVCCKACICTTDDGDVCATCQSRFEKSECIARACGYTKSVAYPPEGGTVECWRNATGYPFKELPDFFDDPKACEEVCNNLRLSVDINRRGIRWLVRVFNPDDFAMRARCVGDAETLAEAMALSIYEAIK